MPNVGSTPESQTHIHHIYFQLLICWGGWGYNPPRFTQESPISTQMHKLGAIPTKFQSVQEEIKPWPSSGFIMNRILSILTFYLSHFSFILSRCSTASFFSFSVSPTPIHLWLIWLLFISQYSASLVIIYLASFFLSTSYPAVRTHLTCSRYKQICRLARIVPFHSLCVIFFRAWLRNISKDENIERTAFGCSQGSLLTDFFQSVYECWPGKVNKWPTKLGFTIKIRIIMEIWHPDKLIDGCSLELCSATPSVASSGICHRNKVNSIAWLYRDGLAIRYYPLHLHLHLHLQMSSRYLICAGKCLIKKIFGTKWYF